MSELPLQRRLERQVVRVQARLEAGLGDRWIPNVLAATLAAVIIRASLARLAAFETGVELAGYSQALWLMTDGKMPTASLFGTDVHLLALSWSFILYPLALLALVFPATKLLVVVQAVALSAAILPLWRLARQVANLRVGASSALVVAYALHPAIHRLGTDDFHPESLALPALIGMAYFGATKRWIPYWLCIAFALACRADLGLAVALWGFVALGNRERLVGLWTLGVGLIWSLGLLLVVQPIVDQGGVVASPFGYDSLGESVLGALRSPLMTLGELFAEENIALVVALLTPLIFLPLLSLRYLAPAFPLAALYLIGDAPADEVFAERSAMLLAFMMISATYALNRLGNMGVDRVFLDVRVLSTLTAASILLFVSTSPISPYHVSWTPDRTDRAVDAALELLEPDDAVRASPSALAHLSDRPWLFALEPNRAPSAAQAGFPDFTEAVLIVEDEIPERTPEEREQFDGRMEAIGFELIFDRDGVGLYSRSPAG